MWVHMPADVAMVRRIQRRTVKKGLLSCAATYANEDISSAGGGKSTRATYIPAARRRPSPAWDWPCTGRLKRSPQKKDELFQNGIAGSAKAIWLARENRLLRVRGGNRGKERVFGGATRKYQGIWTATPASADAHRGIGLTETIMEMRAVAYKHADSPKISFLEFCSAGSLRGRPWNTSGPGAARRPCLFLVSVSPMPPVGGRSRFSDGPGLVFPSGRTREASDTVLLGGCAEIAQPMFPPETSQNPPRVPSARNRAGRGRSGGGAFVFL